MQNSFKTNEYIKAPIPEFEALRLKELVDLNILDTSPEPRFDNLTSLIQQVFSVPICLISLVDRNRQWFKSACGLAVEETSRDVAFCAHAILEPDILLIPDALQDSRFAGNPLVTGEPNIRFYAGAVLRGPTGQPIGSCCIMDQQPRHLTQAEQKQLLRFARLAERELRYGFDLKQLQEQAVANAYYDVLTGLPNQKLFLDRVQQSITVANGHAVIIYVLNIEGFADLSTAWGSAAADQVLIEISQRLCAKAGNGLTVARLREDSFAVLAASGGGTVAESKQPRGSMLPARLASVFDEAIELNGTQVHLAAKIGVARYPEDAHDSRMLLECAQNCLYHSKGDPQSKVVFFSNTSAHRSELSRRFELQQRLRQAIGSDDFYLVYQPIIDLTGNEVCSVETLLRWKDPVLGNVSPAEFIPVAEESGLILQLGDWVLRAACEQVRQWQSQGLTGLPVTVNLASVQLLHDDLAGRIKAVLDDSQLSPDLLHLEVTESGFINDIDRAITNMTSVVDLGVEFLIDDFGTGYSALAYLQKLPLKKLKLDRSFVCNIAAKSEDATLAHGIISLSHNLGLIVVAEGVETQKQLKILKMFGCNQAQGYLFSRPLSPQDLYRLIKDKQPVGSRESLKNKEFHTISPVFKG